MNKQLITINILLFGITKDLVGKHSMTMDLPTSATVAEFKRILFDTYPSLVSMDSMAIAVNSEYAFDDQLIRANDEIALIPPVSGG